MPTISQDVQVAGGALVKVAPLTGTAAPFVAAAGVLVALGGQIAQLFGGCGASCSHDTEVVESFAAQFHGVWYILTGEVLPGVPGISASAQPGQYGAMGINLFQKSSYPQVPYPAGTSGIPGGITAEQAIAWLDNTYQQESQKMVRAESLPNIANNYQYFRSLLTQVAQAEQSAGPANLGSAIAQVPWWGWAAGAAAAMFRFIGLRQEAYA